jgi:hypothetical protein
MARTFGVDDVCLHRSAGQHGLRSTRDALSAPCRWIGDHDDSPD